MAVVVRAHLHLLLAFAAARSRTHVECRRHRRLHRGDVMRAARRQPRLQQLNKGAAVVDRAPGGGLKFNYICELLQPGGGRGVVLRGGCRAALHAGPQRPLRGAAAAASSCALGDRLLRLLLGLVGRPRPRDELHRCCCVARARQGPGAVVCSTSAAPAAPAAPQPLGELTLVLLRPRAGLGRCHCCWVAAGRARGHPVAGRTRK